MVQKMKYSGDKQRFDPIIEGRNFSIEIEYY